MLSEIVKIVTSLPKLQEQEAQLMPTSPHNAYRGQ